MKLKRNEVKEYKERLLALRVRLRGDVSGLAKSALHKTQDGAATNHVGDVGNDHYEQDTLCLMENDGETLAEIEAALERVEDGVYGLCAECEGRIPKTRLNVIPYTAYCVKCASKLEGK